MKKIILSMLFVFASVALVNANSKVDKLYITNDVKSITIIQFDENQIIVRDCFTYAILQLESFEARFWEVSDELGTYILNDAYARCWLDEHPEY